MRKICIPIPKGKNQFQFVRFTLLKLMDSFKDYVFINCTSSPMPKMEYEEKNGLFYRELTKESPQDRIEISSYEDSYIADKIEIQGYSLEEYIEFCLLFELGKVMIVNKTKAKNTVYLNSDHVIATLDICPDGFNEILVTGNKEIVDRISAIVC